MQADTGVPHHRREALRPRAWAVQLQRVYMWSCHPYSPTLLRPRMETTTQKVLLGAESAATKRWRALGAQAC